MEEEQMVERYSLDGAQMMMMSFLAGTMGFLKDNDVSIGDWIRHVGGAFEGSWEAFKGAGADETMGHLIPLLIQPLGVEILSSSGDSDEVKLTMTTLPPRDVLERFETTPEELLDGFGITREEFASIYDLFKPAAEAAGFRFTHGLQGDEHEVTVNRV